MPNELKKALEIHHTKNKTDLKLEEEDVERRFCSDSEFRVSDDDKKIEGYAAKFNVLSPKYFGFREKIRAGAFAKTIKEADIRALFNHNPDYVLGRNKAGTLKIKEDKIGLAYEITPPDTSFARDLKESIKRKDINQSSFGFRVVKDLWEEDDDGNLTRELLEVKLFDISPVTFPWYPTTEATIRSLFCPEEKGNDVLTSLLKLKNNLELKTEDLQNLKKYVTNIEEKIESKSEPQKKHSDESSEPQEQHSEIKNADVLRKKLELFEFENQN